MYSLATTVTLEAITWAVGTAISVSVLIGLMVQHILVPYLRDHLVVPIQRVEHQVTANGGTSSPPTVPDKLSDLRADIAAVRALLDEHLRWSRELVEHHESGE